MDDKKQTTHSASPSGDKDKKIGRRDLIKSLGITGALIAAGGLLTTSDRNEKTKLEAIPDITSALMNV